MSALTPSSSHSLEQFHMRLFPLVATAFLANWRSPGSAETGKRQGLMLQAEAGADVRLNKMAIKNIGASQHVALRGMDWKFKAGPILEFSDNQEPVWIEGSENMLGYYADLGVGRVLRVGNCASIVLRGLTIDPGTFDLA